MRVDDRVFVRRIQKKGESKLISRWQGPYRILSQKNPNVYKLKDLRTGKIVEQHIENIKEKVIMTRESEIPLEECPEARLPFPLEVDENRTAPVIKKRIPEGAEGDDYSDTSYHIEVPVNPEEELILPAPLAPIAEKQKHKKANRKTQEESSVEKQPRRSPRIKANDNKKMLP